MQLTQILIFNKKTKKVMTAVENIRELRKSIDSYVLRQHGKSKKVAFLMSQVELELSLGRAWIGEMLKTLGEPYPYTKDSERKTVEDIKLPADASSDKVLVAVDQVEQNSVLRIAIDAFIVGVESCSNLHVIPSYQRAVTNAIHHLGNARIILGYILGHVKLIDDMVKAVSSYNELSKNVPEKVKSIRVYLNEDTQDYELELTKKTLQKDVNKEAPESKETEEIPPAGTGKTDDRGIQGGDEPRSGNEFDPQRSTDIKNGK